MKPRAFSVAALLGLTFAPVWAGAPSEPDLRVIQSSARTLIFEYRPVYLPAQPLTVDRRRCLRISFTGDAPLSPRPSAGTPDLRARRLAVSVPSREGNRVQVLESSFEDLPATLLAPVPRYRMQDSIFSPAGYTLDLAAYGKPGFQPGSPVSISAPQQVRSLLVSTITVAPVQFNALAQTVRRYSRLVVQVTFGGSGVLAPNHPDAGLMGSALLNGAVLGTAAQTLPRTRAASSSVLAAGRWCLLSVTEDGIYRLDYAALSQAGIPLGTLDPRTLRIFGNGGTELSEDIARPRPGDLVENAIYVQGEDDGKFDPGDYLLFYGRSVRGFAYNPATRSLEHYLHHYTETNVYWLTYGGAAGKRMALQQSETIPATFVPDRFQDAIAVEEEKLKPKGIISGKLWAGCLLNAGSPSFTYRQSLPGLVPGTGVGFRYALIAHAFSDPVFTVRSGAHTVGIHHLGAADPAGYLMMNYGLFEAYDDAPVSPLPVSFSFSSADGGADGYIDWLETRYMRFFYGSGNYLRFWGPDTTAVVEYNLQQFSQTPMVFNVSSPADVRLVAGVAGNALFRAQERAGSRTEYVAAAPSAWKAPAGIQSAQNQDLHGALAAGAEYVIITSTAFRPAADRLAAFRRQAAHGGLQTAVVDVAEIYNEFSGGLPDVSAVRDFLKYACDTWQRKPAIVLLFGGASYDYKAILGSVTSIVPTWESEESLHEVYSIASDDFFAALGGGSIPWFALGRIAARTPAEAQAVVDKIVRYEDASDQTTWKMRMLFIADDAWTSEGGDAANGTDFGNYVDRTLASSECTPDEFEKRKVYIAEYPTVYEAQGRRKPGAYEDIIRYINEGVAVVNYDGHGNPLQLAHENIFNVQTSIPRLKNAGCLPLFYLATCSFSQFDDPTRYSGSELLLNKADGGAIGCLGAVRKVFADEGLLAEVYRWTFTRGPMGRLVLARPAAALFAAKVARNLADDRTYLFLGDPAMRLQFPAGYASIDSINGQPVDSINGRLRTQPLRLPSLSRVTIKGAMRDALGAVDSACQGSMTLLVNDASRWRTIVDYYPGTDWGYLATGAAIFRGEHTVKNGRFEARFVVPRDITYADSTGRGRIVAYVKGTGGDGQGYTGNVAIAGVDSAAAYDSRGPHIALYLNSRSFRPGDLVSSHPVLLADFTDSSGINTSKAGIGHRIEAWVNDAPASLDLTDLYTSEQDNYRQGAVRMPLEGLPAGHNTVRVRAWDTFNNSATAETHFEVSSSDGALTLADVFNYPNPFDRMGTSFTFRHNQHASGLRVRIRIYTVAGRLIQALEGLVPAGEPFAKIPWDGRDRDGDILANGVYLYKLLVSTDDGRSTAEALGKLAVLR